MKYRRPNPAKYGVSRSRMSEPGPLAGADADHAKAPFVELAASWHGTWEPDRRTSWRLLYATNDPDLYGMTLLPLAEQMLHTPVTA